MKSVIASLVAVAGMSVAANAIVNTSVVWQVNNSPLIGGAIDPNGWTSNVSAAPGTLVFVRARVAYTGTAAPLGFASMVFQPTVSNWGDNTLSPFVNNGAGGNTTTPSGVVTNQGDTTSFGRLSPWGRSSLATTARLNGFVQTGAGPATNPVPAGTWLRIAQLQVTSWIGGTGNTTGGSGVPIAQLANVGRTSNDPAFNSVITGVNVFKMGITVGNAQPGGTVMTIGAPLEGFGNRNTDSSSADFGNRECYWWADLNEATGSIRGTAAVTIATITVPIPTPASLALLGLGGLAVGRRRR